MNKEESLALLAQGREAWNAWAFARVQAAIFGEPDPILPCAVGPGDPAIAALGLSLRNGLLFAGASSSEKLNQIYACLYGAHGSSAPAPDQFPVRFRPVIPDAVSFLSVLQALYSAVLVFLFLLAIRNHFRIK